VTIVIITGGDSLYS